ncbi:hypothetical protein FHG64_06575 [Antarcticibacterium flavum]|uniref:Uncharacterized protein n=1 Tax=Antarcticibacterium flavum TaxID=2058175 RepID=A0A5B7X154_9FLAO|nr:MULTISPECIES: hypothetical protein [Antarcticibacterium]QCY69097.1 hypothetical protein FHG64_06575 [Antarcticibacterium flavum]
MNYKSIYIYSPLIYNMLALILLIILLFIAVLLFFQLKVRRQQEKLIKDESKALRKLQKTNSRFIESGLFGLKPTSSYLKPTLNHSGLIKHRRNVMGGRKKVAAV